VLRVHLVDGRTLCLDLSDEQQASRWLDQVSDVKYQAAITGLTLQSNGTQHSLSKPNGYGRVWLFAEYMPPIHEQRFKGGERIICQADDSRAVVMVHAAQRASRISMSKTGDVVYNALERR